MTGNLLWVIAYEFAIPLAVLPVASLVAVDYLTRGQKPDPARPLRRLWSTPTVVWYVVPSVVWYLGLAAYVNDWRLTPALLLTFVFAVALIFLLRTALNGWSIALDTPLDPNLPPLTAPENRAVLIKVIGILALAAGGIVFVIWAAAST